MLLVAIEERHRYMSYFRIVAEPRRGVNSSSGLMVASGAAGLVQPVLFLCIHVVYPLVRQRQWAAQDDCKRRDSDAEQQRQEAQRGSGALHAKSSRHHRSFFDRMGTSALPANNSHLGPPQSGLHVSAEEAPQDTEAARVAAADVSATDTAALHPSPPTQGLRHLRPGSLLLLKPSSDPPLSAAQPPGTHSFSSPPQKAVVSRGSCATAVHVVTTAFSAPSMMDAEIDMQHAATPLSFSPPVDADAVEVASTASVAATVPLGLRPTGSCPAASVPKAPFCAVADGAVISREGHNDAVGAAEMTAVVLSYAGVSGGTPAVSDPASPPASEVTRAVAQPLGNASTSELGGNASGIPCRQMLKSVAQRALSRQGDVDGSTPAAATAAVQNAAVSRPDASLAKSVANPLRNPLTPPPLDSVYSSGADSTTYARQDCTGALTVTPSESCNMVAPTAALTVGKSCASATKDTHAAVRSSEEVPPSTASAKEVRRCGHRHRCSSSETPPCDAASVLSRALPWFTPRPVTAEALPPQSHVARWSSAPHLKVSARPLPPALLHMYFKSETTFHSLLTLYYTFAAFGILLMYFFGMLWVVRKELKELNTLVSMADGWNNVFIYQNITESIDAALCKVELDGKCSGGANLCNATLYASADAAHSVSCPFCSASQQKVISTFTEVCPTVYDPNIWYSRAFLIFLALAVSTSLVSLCVAVFSCGTGVLASVGFAAASEREKEAREAQAVLDARGLFSLAENATVPLSSHAPARASPPLSNLATEEEALSLTSLLVVAPSRERLMHTFEGLHAPSAALLPPAWAVMAEMSDSGDSPLMPPGSMMWTSCSPGTSEARKAPVRPAPDGADDTRCPTSTYTKNAAASVI
ncbi:hypothetical protein LSCM1_02708 [Leishmania martiniquensis]|uniref:Uncharacterized protein n=1 Tax=Leishmania martiniquensis TaxID=1580590 RepID=A0A836GKR1_9TRYP|nr:hypothetical protein LSCM1_02708 [Leishmania martiniquensis]